MNHWTEEEMVLLRNVETFEELANIAVSSLERMSREGHEIVQICGPMSTGGLGNFAGNMARFRLAIDRAVDHGLAVFDQLPFQQEIIRLCSFKENQEEYDWEILEIFYRGIFESGHVKRAFFLDGWQNSTGASWERRLVTSLGIPVENYPTEWLT